MTNGGMLVGVLSNGTRYALFEQMVRESGIAVETSDGKPLKPATFAPLPACKRVLEEWDAAGVDIALVDDESFNDKEAMVAGIGRFLAAQRARGGRMQVVFVADLRRRADDEVFGRLTASGLTDIVVQTPGSSLANQVAAVLRAAARTAAGRAATKAEGLPDYGTGCLSGAGVVPQRMSGVSLPTEGPASTEEQTKDASRGKSVIAVAGIMPRSGATNCSVVLARTLAMLGQTPALIVDKRAGNGFRKGYRAAMRSDGRSFRVNGVDIYPEAQPSEVPRRYSHVVLDVGYLGWGKSLATAEEQNKVIQFNKADLQVVYVPCSSPADFEYVQRFFDSQRAADLERYAIGVWGATEGVFAMLRDRVREKAPEVFMWNVAVYRWPLSLGSLSADMVEVLRPVLSRSVYARVIRKLREAEAAAVEVGKDYE